MDYIFVVNIHASQQLGGMQPNMFIMGAYSSILMNLNWLQRFYSKANLDDSEEISIDSEDNLASIAATLGYCLDKMEQTNFKFLWSANGEAPARVFALMVDRIYAGTFEAMVMIENEMQNRVENAKEDDSDG